MSKRGPLDAYFAKLPNAANKKAKQAGDVAGKELQTDSGQQLDTNSKQHGSSDQQVQASVLQVVEQQQQRQTAAEVLPGSESTAAAAGNQQRLAAELQDVAVQQPAAAATPAVAPNDAFGALMAASKGKTLVGGDSNSSKLSAEEMQQQADRNQAAAMAVVQEAAAAQQHPQLKSLLVEPSWLQVLAPEFEKPYMGALQGFLQQEWASQVIYPPQDSIFRAFNAVPFDQVRVVILGQDPYINAGEAMGLSFSVPPGIRVPPSLVNIYKELGQDIRAKIPKHGCLKKWCSQGVLLLNAALTVRAKNSNSHAGKGWESFTSAALTALAKQRSGIVFMLWGKYAQDRCAKLNLKKHHVLKSVHPSPLSAHRGFLGCRHFSTANKMLVQAGQRAIDWQIDDA